MICSRPCSLRFLYGKHKNMDAVNLMQREIMPPAMTDQSVLPTIWVAGHELRVFTASAALYDSMLSDIQRGRARVWLERYIFHPDAAGRAVASALKERARAGLD